MIHETRTRLHRPLRFAAGLLAAAAALAFASPAMAVPDRQASAKSAAAWLVAHQDAGGGLPGLGGAVGAGSTADGIAALVASATSGTPLEGALDFLASQTDAYTRTSTGAKAGPSGKVAMTAVAGGRDPRSFGGVDVLARLESTYDSATGGYGAPSEGVFGQALAMLGLESAERTVSPEAAQYLLAAACTGGGWSYMASAAGDCSAAYGADTNSTALAVQALRGAGFPASNTTITSAVAFLHASQESDGGFPYQAGFGTDANSTGVVLQAIAALGEDPTSSAWSKSGSNPVAALAALQFDSGAFSYQAGGAEDASATAQAAWGMAGKAFPLSVVAFPPLASVPSPTPLSSPSASSSPQPSSSPSVATTLDLGKLTAGATIAVHAQGFAPGTRVTFLILSDPVILGGVDANSHGVASGSFALPASIEPGAHRIIARGSSSDGSSREVLVATLTISGELPRTGFGAS
ncbi:MAG: hypothetical protein WDA71_05200, partial [Actinomycetota bacterium]